MNEPDVEIKKVVIIGPECTGKSELSEYLAGHYNTVWVPEFARQYLAELDRAYGPLDLPVIANGQLALEDKLIKDAKKVLFCDTDLYVIKIWSYFKYGYCDQRILDAIAARKYDLYLLTYVDIPWISDPLREHPDQRDELYAHYLREMQNQSVPFVVIKGEREQRQAIARNAVSKLLQTSAETRR